MNRALKAASGPGKDSVEADVEGTFWAQITASIGADAALALSKNFGGHRLYIRRDPGAHHPITVAIGAEAAKALGDAHHGRYVDVPLAGANRERIIELLGQGMKISRIAALVRCTERHVWQVQRDAKKAGKLTSNQPDLWG